MPVFSSYDNLFTSLACKKAEAQRKIQTVTIVYKSVNGLALQYLNSLFSYRNEVSSYSLTDSKDKLAIPLNLTNYVKTDSATKVRCCGIAYLLSCGKRKLLPPLNKASA